MIAIRFISPNFEDQEKFDVRHNYTKNQGFLLIIQGDSSKIHLNTSLIHSAS